MPTISQRLAQFGSFDLRQVEDPSCPPPPQPTMAVSSTASGIVAITWNAPNADTIQIYRSPGNIVYQSHPEVGTAPATGTFIDKTLDPKIYYTYIVRSSNTCGESWSSAATIKPTCAIPQPCSLSITEGQNTISVTFDTKPNAILYNLHRNDGTIIKISVPSGVPSYNFVDTNVLPGITYTYTLEANNECGSSWSNVVTGTIECELPPKTVLDLSADYKDITVAWNEVTNVTKYRLYRWKESEPKLLISEFIAGDNTYSYKDESLDSETQYYYQIELVNDCGSIFSDAFNIAISCENIERPEIFLTSGNQSATIEWLEVDVATEYQIWRDNEDELISITTGDTKYIVDPTAAQIRYKYIDENLGPGETYSYRVIAKTDCKSITSNAKSLRIKCDTPSIPDSFKAVSSVEKVVLLWGPTENALGYKIFRNDESRPIATIVNTKYIDTSVTPGIAYSYQVIAYNDCGESQPTDKKIVAVKCACMTPPANVMLTRMENTLRLNWDVEPAALSYEIFKNGLLYNEVKEAEFTDLYLEGSGLVFYQVRAKNVCEITKLSKIVEYGVKCTEMIGQFNLRIVGKTDTSATYVWDEILNATKYMIRKYNTTTGTSEEIEVKELMQTNIYSDFELQENSNYKITVYAFNACGDKIQSEVVAISTSCNIPQFPIGMQAVSVTPINVKLSWSKSERAESYIIYRNGYKYDEADGTFFNDKEVEEAQKYFYAIAAKNACGETSKTSTLQVYVPCNKTKKTEITEIIAARNSIYLTWTEETTEEYWLYRNGKRIARLELNEFEDVGLQSGTQFEYRIATVNKCHDTVLSKPKKSITCYDIQVPLNFEINEITPITAKLEFQRAHLDDIIEVWRNDSLIDTITTDGYMDDSDLVPGEIYTYRLGIKNSCETIYSSNITVTLPSGPEGSINLVANYIGSTYNCLSWTTEDLKFEEGYIVERAEKDLNTNFAEIAKVPKTTNYYKDEAIAENTNYLYRVAPINAYGTGNYSNQLKAKTKFHTPIGFYTKLKSSTETELNWINSSTLYKKIEIQRSDGDIDHFRTISNIDGTLITYVDSNNLLPQSNYFYRIRGFTDGLEGQNISYIPYENTSCMNQIPMATPISVCDTQNTGDLIDIPYNSSNYTEIKCVVIDRVPTIPCLSVTQINNSSIQINWVDYTGGYADGYIIEKSEDSITWREYVTLRNNLNEISPIIVNTYTDSNVSPEKRYWYRMIAFVGQIKSAYSKIDSASTLINKPLMPLIKSLVQENNTLKIIWTNNSEAVDNFEYNVIFETENITSVSGLTYNVSYQITELGTYYVKVRSKKSGDYSFWSIQHSIIITQLIPSQPIITGFAIGPRNIKITIHDIDTINSEYTEIYRDGVFYRRSEFVDSIIYDWNLTQLTVYDYKIRLGNSLGVSEFSDEISLMTLKENVAAPELIITSTDYDHINWKISSSINYDEYKIERAKDAIFSDSLSIISGITGTLPISGIDSNVLSAETDYYYRAYGQVDSVFSSGFITSTDGSRYSAIIPHNQNAEVLYAQVWGDTSPTDTVIDVDSFDILDKNRIKLYTNEIISGDLYVIASDNDDEKWNGTITTIPDDDGVGHSVLINHNLGITKPLVQCWKDNQIIYVQEIEDVNLNVIKIRTGRSITFEVKIFKPTRINTVLRSFTTIPDSGSYTAIIAHNLNQYTPMLQIWKESLPNPDVVILPEIIEVFDQNNIQLWFNQPVTGYVRFVEHFNINYSDPSRIVPTRTDYNATEDQIAMSVAVIESTTIILNWTVIHRNATQYRIYRKISTQSVFFQIATIDVNIATYTDADLMENTTYNYYVIPWCLEFGEGAASAIQTLTTLNILPTDVPNHLTARNSDGSVVLKWNFEQTNMSLLVKRKILTDISFTQIAEVNENLYLDDSISSGITYQYRIDTKYGNKVSNIALIKI
jgi:hypothetical protein